MICHPYDDRGMDVIGCRKPALAALYARHRDLLLAYDLDIMDETFGAPRSAIR